MRRPSVWLPVAAWCALIFLLSQQAQIGPSGPSGPALTWPEYLLRKSGHVVEYGVLYQLVRRGWPPGRSWLFCLIFAISDEWHQSFVPGRFGRPSDVALDAAAAAVSALLRRRNSP